MLKQAFSVELHEIFFLFSIGEILSENCLVCGNTSLLCEKGGKKEVESEKKRGKEGKNEKKR